MPQDPNTFNTPIAAPNQGQRVQAPAIALLVSGILGALAALTNFLPSRELPPEQLEQMEQMFGPEGIAMMLKMQSLGPVFGIIGLAASALVIFGSLKMKNLEKLTLSRTSAILAMIPGVFPCCLLGLPFGIWALIAIGKEKSAFKS